jgi:hypothetical protein
MAAIPGPSTGVDPSLLNAPLSVKRQYTDDMFGAIAAPDGGNVVARAYGLSPPMQEGFGPWQGMLEPNRQIEFGVGTIGSGGEKAIDPSSAKLETVVRNQNQFLLGQEGAGRTVPRADGATKKAGDLAVIRGVPMAGEADYTRAMQAVKQVYGPSWADNVVVQPSPDGGLMLKNIAGGNNPEFHAAAKEVHKMLGGTGQNVMRDVGNDFSFVQFNDPSYRSLMDETRSNPKIKAVFDEKVLPSLPALQKASENWAKKMGVAADTVPDRVRRIFISAGDKWPEAMDEAVKKGIIPAFAVPFVYGAMRDQFAEEER